MVPELICYTIVVVGFTVVLLVIVAAEEHVDFGGGEDLLIGDLAVAVDRTLVDVLIVDEDVVADEDDFVMISLVEVV
jgi:hypothetical protein